MRVRDMRKQFRILKNWSICIDSDPRRAGHTHFNPKQKVAVIEAWSTGGKPEPADYIFHELLHICLTAIRRMDKRKAKELRQAEEELIQDICLILEEINNERPKKQTPEQMGL